MLSQQIFDATRLPSAVWALMFNNVELYYQNKKVEVRLVNLSAGGTIKKVIVGDFTYLEQNPHSSSQY